MSCGEVSDTDIINLNKGPIQTQEKKRKLLFNFLEFKKNRTPFVLFFKTEFEIIYKSCKFIELVENFKLKSAQYFFKLEKNLEKIFFFKFNSIVCCRFHFFFSIESALLVSKTNTLYFYFIFHVVDFLSVKSHNNSAFRILNEIHFEKKSRKLKTFDVYFFSENYSKVNKLMSKLQISYINAKLTHKIKNRITFRFAKFFIIKKNFRLSISYFTENLLKSMGASKLKKFCLVEFLFFCSIFVKNLQYSFICENFTAFLIGYNFKLIKILYTNLKITTILVIRNVLKKKTQSIAKKLFKYSLLDFFDFFLIKKVKKIIKSYIRISVDFISAKLKMKRKKFIEIAQFLTLVQKVNMYWNKKYNFYILFKKKYQPSFVCMLFVILKKLSLILC